MPPAPGDTSDWKGTYFIGRYRVVDEIGVGGMASVFLARVDGAGGFQKWVAIKRIHPHLTEKDHVVSMFLDEARIAASISHPNVAQVFDLGQHEGGYWIAMEYLHGEAVREICRLREASGVPTPPSLVARIISDAAEGLHAAHDLRGKDGQLLNLVHRDVSPHNLFITYDGVVKVVDFGIAKVAGRQIQTRVGVLRGKLAYMSPEQARCKPIDRRTDVFALGVVAWELLTGRRLFRGKNDLDTVRNVLSMPIASPRSIQPAVPANLDAAVLQALERDPDRRFQTAREFSRALQQYLVAGGQLVGPEEIGAFVSSVFHDRVSMREAHLKWAAEVTQTISLDKLVPPASQHAASSPSPEAQLTGSIALPLLRPRPSEDNAMDWDQPTVPRGKAAAPIMPPPAPPMEDDSEPELRTEVGPTWGVERDQVVRSLVRSPTATVEPALPQVPSAAAPPAIPAAIPSAPPYIPSQPAPPTPPPPAASFARYILAATVTFVIVAILSLILVFAFRTRIRATLGIRPSPTAVPASS